MHLLEDIKQRQPVVWDFSDLWMLRCRTRLGFCFCLGVLYLRPAHFTSQPIILQLYLRMHCSPQPVIHLSVLSPTFPSFPIQSVVMSVSLLYQWGSCQDTICKNVCARHSFLRLFPILPQVEIYQKQNWIVYNKKNEWNKEHDCCSSSVYLQLWLSTKMLQE